MAKNFSISDCIKMLKDKMPSDVKNASAEELSGALNELKNYVSGLSEEINGSKSEEVREKYAKGVNALDSLIENGIKDPNAEIDTSELDEYIKIAKNSKLK